MQIDHVLYNSDTDYKVYNFRVINNVKNNKHSHTIYPSDHYPVITEFFSE